MKKCAKDFESYSVQDPKRAATPAGSKKLKASKSPNTLNSNHPEPIEKPNAPHNTTEYLMDQHIPVLFDPEELLGHFFGIRSKENFFF